ncbi:hypothetical protein OMK64_10945 [Cellulomonas fimi]|uniref:alpha/beta hydrolase family protein n=1 Tax=Cellulomonas fimi TaxID=1708 RepID=UPI00234D72E2|nr:hypothetical protein [Cellulomonas fimi]MDC7122054.1 hypothetical protein [Cellulomonas fimi]
MSAALAGMLLLAACSAGEAAGSGRTAAAGGPTQRSADAPPCLPDGTRAAAVGPEDDPTLVAWTGEGTDAVVLAPQNGGGPCQWADQMARLAGEGYLVASFSWSGDSRASLLAAVDAVRAAGAEQVALVGASKGGTYAAGLAAEADAVAVVALGPPADLDGVDARPEESGYDGPLLVVASTNDGDVAVGSSRWVSRPDDPSTFLELPGGAHGVALFTTAHREQVQAAMDATLARGFGR